MKNKEFKKIVIKVGTSSITHSNGKLNLKQIDKLARIICDLYNNGKKIVLVTSGAISAGVARLNLNGRPTDIASKQAVACVGQNALMEIYNTSFARYGYNIGQMLLSKYVFDHDVFYENAKNSIFTLWNMNVVPIINENDSITADEIKMGDNDNLSSNVAKLIGADLLIILSDIQGIYDSNPKTNPNAKLLSTISANDTELIKSLENDQKSDLGTGGIKTKLQAGVNCALSNIDAVVASSQDLNVIYDILEGKNVGTNFTGEKTK